MKALVLSALMLVAFSTTGYTQDQRQDIVSVEVVEDEVSVAELQELRKQFQIEAAKLRQSQEPINNELDIIDKAVDKVIGIGSKVWKVIVANQPVVNLNTQRVSALPEDNQNWFEMENWSDLEARRYVVTYKNGFGVEVVKLSYMITYTYGGSFEGKGQYLSNVGFLVSAPTVLWGYTLDAHAEVVRVQNVATLDNPIAALELNFNWSVKTPLKHSINALNFFVRGDGKLTARAL